MGSAKILKLYKNHRFFYVFGDFARSKLEPNSIKNRSTEGSKIRYKSGFARCKLEPNSIKNRSTEGSKIRYKSGWISGHSGTNFEWILGPTWGQVGAKLGSNWLQNRSKTEQPRNSQEQPGGSSQEQPGTARNSQEPESHRKNPTPNFHPEIRPKIRFPVMDLRF